MLIRALLLVALAVSGVAHADSFNVQIGAYRNPDVNGIEVPANIGEVQRTTGPGGLTRLMVGPFAGRELAEKARDELKAAGFKGAFIRSTLDASTATTQSPTEYTAPRVSVEHESGISERDLAIVAKLSEDERRALVYLDGRLHRKVGDDFIPLRD